MFKKYFIQAQGRSGWGGQGGHGPPLQFLKKACIISGPQLNIITSILELLKTLSEVIVTSRCGPLARIKKQAMS